eukprot:TRINITY_DN2133_c0_g1_i6.p1 TRINITY_DN2133_c0_g1~~TRINITY_DN2133_c0_g1_i6.p1  ORF type:complete len:206 (-),score=44.68 TRINITY_DN2133_c0_g1_i6:92-709(-)
MLLFCCAFFPCPFSAGLTACHAPSPVVPPPPPRQPEDLLAIQSCNISCLPENYQMKYYFYHILSWPQLMYVAEDSASSPPRIVGYVLAKNGGGRTTPPTCTATSPPWRSCGRTGSSALPTASCRPPTLQCGRASAPATRASTCAKSNAAAKHLYVESLGYKIHDIEAKYYADAEDAYDMRKKFEAAAEGMGGGGGGTKRLVGPAL